MTPFQHPPVKRYLPFPLNLAGHHGLSWPPEDPHHQRRRHTRRRPPCPRQGPRLYRQLRRLCRRPRFVTSFTPFSFFFL